MIRQRVTKTGKLKFEARIKINGRKLYKICDSEQAALDWIKKISKIRSEGLSPRFEKVTIDMLFENYMHACRLKGNAPSSIKKERCAFQNHLKPYYGSFNLLSVSIKEHAGLIKYLFDKDLDPETINRIRSTMNTVYNTAIRLYSFGDALRSNPFTAVKKVKVMEKRMPYWDLAMTKRFLESEKTSTYYPLWILMLNTGIRIGEAVALHSEQFDLSANLLSIDRIWCGVANGIRPETKSSRIRDIGLNESVQKETYPFLRTGPIFQGPDGGLLRADYVSKTAFPRACKRAQVEDIGCHGLRHTFASNFMMNGGNIWDLQKILGHSDLKTTQRYTKFSRKHQQAIAKIVEFSANVITVDFEKKATA